MSNADPGKDEYLEVEKKLGAAELELAANLADADKALDAGVEKRKKRVSAARTQLKWKAAARSRPWAVGAFSTSVSTPLAVSLI